MFPPGYSSALVRPSLLFLALLLVAGCGSSGGVMTKPIDLSTPEAAVLSLEEAYRARDVNAAVKCKDFRTEAVLMLQKVSPQLASDAAIIGKTTEVLEIGRA